MARNFSVFNVYKFTYFTCEINKSLWERSVILSAVMFLAAPKLENLKFLLEFHLEQFALAIKKKKNVKRQ